MPGLRAAVAMAAGMSTEPTRRAPTDVPRSPTCTPTGSYTRLHAMPPPEHPPLASGRMWLDPGVACGQLGVAVAAIPPTGHGHGALLVWWLCIESSVLGTHTGAWTSRDIPLAPLGPVGRCSAVWW